MDLTDPRNGTRSLVCDSSGIIVAETVFRCMRCFSVFQSVSHAKDHYYEHHLDDSDEEGDGRDTPCFSPNGFCTPSYGSPSVSGPCGVCNNSNNDMAKEVQQQVQAVVDTKPFRVQKERVSSSSSLSDTHPTVVKALTGAFNPGPVPIRSLTANLNVINEANGNVSHSIGKAGHMQCAVCGVVRFYSHVYRRYGHLTCQVCYRFFRTFFQGPKIFTCPGLGSCNLSVRKRCRACWLLAAVNLFPLDHQRQDIISQFYPRHGESVKSPGQLSRCSNPLIHDPGEYLLPLDLRKLHQDGDEQNLKQFPVSPSGEKKRKILLPAAFPVNV